MCLGCWERSGKPWLVTPAVDEWAPRFAEADPFGALHIVVDDWNLDDGSLRWCLDNAEEMADRDLMTALLAMTRPERWAVAILADNPAFDPSAYVDVEH